MKFGRRMVLKGVGGAVLGLPLLESFSNRAVAAGANDTFAIFFRQANGVAAAQSYTLNGNSVKHNEPERFWPTQTGALSAATLQGRALDELSSHASKLLVVGNVNMKDFPYGDGHARGALQCLTAQGPVVADAAGGSEANGESIDHRIGRELNPEGRESLFLYAGPKSGWLGGACLSYRGPNQRKAALADPLQAYNTITGGANGASNGSAELVARQKSVNDLVRAQLDRLTKHPRLSQTDRERLDLHLTSVREIEVSLGCQLAVDQAKVLEGGQPILTDAKGEERLRLTKMHMDVAALAVACGYTRSVAIQVGDGNDSSSRFLNPDDPNQRWENYHYISHRILAHGGEGTEIMGADMMHHKIDRYFAQTFKYLLDKLAAYQLPGGGTLLDAGVAVWHNDLGSGPSHSAKNVPYIMAGSCNGYFKQNQYIRLPDGQNHNKLLNTIATAVGVTKSGGPLDDFGDATLPIGLLPELKA